jgi:filamentous hemagglutinin family protein
MQPNNRSIANPPTSQRAWVLGLGVLLSMGAWAGPASNALPTGGSVQAGQASITQSQNTLNVNQTSQRAVVGWNTFNVGKDATVNFNQPNANASTLNIVNGATKSMIDGAVNANGQVIFVNPNGVVFGKNAEVNVGGLVATTMNVDPNAYMAGSDTQTYRGNGSGKVVNKGRITVNDVKGYVALMAPEVVNEGVITATLSGKNAVALVSGEQVTIQIQDRQMLSISVDASAIKSLIQNKRLIQVEGGQVLLAATAAKDLKNSVIQNTGVISATGITSNGGKISLRANSVTQSGTIAANSAAAVGGEVTITGHQVTLESGSVTTATGASGGGQILVGTTALKPDATTQLAKTVDVKTNALVDASATQSGHGGTVAIWSSQTTTVAGVLHAKGGAVSGNGGQIETSSSGQVIYGASLVVDTSAAKGKTGLWTTDPVAIVVDNQAATVLTRALSSTNVLLDATLSACGGVGDCTSSALPSITFLPGADVYAANALTSLTLNAVGGNIHIQSNIAAGQVYAVAQEISVPGSIYSTGGANGNIYLMGAALNILGRVGSNGSSGSTTSGAATGTAGATANRRRTSSGDALTSDGNIYTSDAGKVTLIATGDITLGSATDNSTTITANGIHGGVITIVSLNGNVKNYGVVDALGLNGHGGSISIAGSQRTDFVGALMSVDGLQQGGVFQIGVANAVGTGATLAPPSINAQVATLLAAINFSPSVSSTLLSAQTLLDSATLVSANAQASYPLQATNFSKAGSIYIAGNDSLNTSATITANADIGGLILLSSPAGMYQNAGYIQTNGGAGLGGTIAQSGFVSTALTGATLEANGQLGGGNIVTGRDFQANPILNNATQDALLPVLSSVVQFPTSALTVIDATSRFSANAVFGGNAGNILVWGNQLAAFGTFNAKALGATGNGGFIETSGQQLLLTDIQVSASANHGSSGTWLLDPFDVTIANSGASGTNYAAIFSAGSTSTILASSIVSHLNAGTNVSISTGSNSANTIYVTTPISATGAGSLTLTAGTIELQQNITTGGAQTYNGAVRLTNNITLTTSSSNVVFYTTVNGTSAGAQSLTVANGSGTIALGGNVGGSVALSSLNFSSSTATTLLGGSVTTTGSQNYAGSVSVGGTTSSLNSNSGGITVGGTISSFAGGVTQFTGNGSYIYSGAASQTASSIPTLVGNWMVSWSGSSYAVVPLFNSLSLIHI